MKLKQSVLIMMAAALPVVSFAASEIPVTKDTQQCKQFKLIRIK